MNLKKGDCPLFYANGELTDEQFEDALLEAGLNTAFDVTLGKVKILEKSYELARKAGLTDKADDLIKKIANHKNGGNNRPPVSNPSAIQVANAEKYGVDPRWVKPDGNIDWPPNNGFAGGVEIRELQSGQVFDRYGGRYVNGKFEDTGTFVAPTDVPFDQRALPNSALDNPKKTYEIVHPIPGVNTGQAAPWFGKPGGGTQYQLPFSIDYLLNNGFIRELN